MKPERLYERIKQGHRHNVRFTDFVRLMEAFGFRHIRTKGSHQSYQHASTGAKLVVQPDRNDEAKDYQIDQFLTKVNEYRLTMKDRP